MLNKRQPYYHARDKGEKKNIEVVFIRPEKPLHDLLYYGNDEEVVSSIWWKTMDDCGTYFSSYRGLLEITPHL